MSLALATRGFYGSGGASDPTAPTITIISPTPGAVIGPSTPLIFRYADDTDLRRPLPCAKIRQSDGQYKYELIHDGEDFTPDFQGTKEVIQASPPIWQFTVRRRGGWSSAITYEGVQAGDTLQLVPFGTDTSGNEPG